MSYYLRVFQELYSSRSQVWEITETEATRFGVSNPKSAGGSYVSAEPGETIWAAIRRQTPWFEPNGENPFHPITLSPGEYYPRMARPNDQHFHESPGANPGIQGEATFIATAVGQLNALTTQLGAICQTVHPAGSNMQAFGHDIRNLLILACTEVEAHWRGVLEANGVTGRKSYSTLDYCKLRDAMRLNEYAVTFPRFPWLKAVSPFQSWDTQNPTASLAWYDAYNAVKHNRDGEFERASLQNLFDAVTACAVMQVAQFGLHGDGWRHSDPAKFFHFQIVPRWLPKDVYVHPYEGQGRQPVAYPF